MKTKKLKALNLNSLRIKINKSWNVHKSYEFFCSKSWIFQKRQILKDEKSLTFLKTWNVQNFKCSVLKN